MHPTDFLNNQIGYIKFNANFIFRDYAKIAVHKHHKRRIQSAQSVNRSNSNMKQTL